jgi:hypothetical protein
MEQQNISIPEKEQLQNFEIFSFTPDRTRYRSAVAVGVTHTRSDNSEI